jgi:hypothetical protein
MTARATCRHCGREIRFGGVRWIDPAATGDDSIWRDTCADSETFPADHEPGLPARRRWRR